MQLTKQGKNKDHEAEKRKEQEEFEKKLGLLTYLGQTALEEKGWSNVVITLYLLYYLFSFVLFVGVEYIDYVFS